MYKRVLILTCAAFLTACNVTRVVKPLDKGEHQVSASFGGPAIVFSGMPMPLPLSSISYAQGLDTGITMFAGLHTTSLLAGVVQMDAGLNLDVFRTKNERFGLTGSPGIHLFYDFNGENARAYPQLESLVWWRYSDKDNFLYGGGGTWIELYRKKAHGQVQDHELMPYVTLGHQFERPNWSFQIEGRYLGLPYSNQDIVVNYLSPFNKGTAGIYFGVSRRFNAKSSDE